MQRFAILIVLAACGGDGGGGGGNPDGGGTVLVEGVPAEQFYGQFSYAKTQTGIEGAAAFATNAAGNNAFLATAFLMPNNALTLFYAEGEGSVDATGWSLNIQNSTKKRRTGTWKVQGAKLVLGDFMACDGLTFDGAPKLRCTLGEAIVSGEAQGKGGMFAKRFSAATPDDSEFAGYGP